LRRLDSDVAKPVDGSTGIGGGSAAFSPDGKWLAFGLDKKVFKALVKGGPPTQIATSGWAQIAWLGDKAIVYTKSYDAGLNRVSADGTDTATLTVPDRKKGELGHWWPQVLPDGDHVLFTNYTTPADRSKIEVISLKSRKRQVVLDGGYFGRYVDGHLLFVRNRIVSSVSFDPGNLRVSGSPVSLPLDIETVVPNGWAAFAVAPTGTLAYRTEPFRNVVLTWSDESGNEEPAVDSSGRYTSFSPSPDGKKIALVRDGDVWVYDRQRSLFTRFTDTEQIESALTWSPDSREVFYVRDVPQYDIFKRAADASRAEEVVVTSSNDKGGMGISPDGRTLLYWEDVGGHNDIYASSPNPGDHARPTRIISVSGSQARVSFSPDGQWITYTSDESGRSEIYLAPYPVDRGPVRQQVSVGGGEGSKWSDDGRAIYYGLDNRIWRVRVNPQTGDIGKPERLTKIQPTLGWTFARDGRLLVSRVAKSAERHSIKVILNWSRTLNDTTGH
jgi:eukaryotic-like serine/threonine-protein kinase